MHGYGMERWNMGWIWIFGVVLIALLFVLICGKTNEEEFERRRIHEEL
jgi:hypothetical protein